MEKEEKIGQLLVAEGVLKAEQLKEALEKQKTTHSQKALGELLIELGMVSESDFLRILAKQFRTQYVTTDKLAQLSVPSAILKLVPQATAEKHSLLPIQYIKKEKSLSIVTIDPLNVAALDEVKFASGIPNIKALVGTKTAIKAGIDKFYKGNDRAFNYATGLEEEEGEIERTGGQGSGAMDNMFGGSGEVMLDPDDDGKSASIQDDDAPLEIAGVEDVFAKAAPPPPPPPPKPSRPEPQRPPPTKKTGDVFLGGLESFPGDDNLQRPAPKAAEPTVSFDSFGGDAVMDAPAKTTVREKAKEARKYHKRMIVIENHAQIRDFLKKLFGREGFQVDGVSTKEEAIALAGKSDYDVLVIKEKYLGEGTDFEDKLSQIKPDLDVHVIKGYGSGLIGETRLYNKIFDSFFETLDVVISLMEMDREPFKGHTHLVAKYVKLLGQKMGLSKKEADELRMAAYAHDIGKKGMKHFTLLDTLQDGFDFEQVKDAIEIPVKLLSPANLPIDLPKALKNSFERYDGKGFPNRKKAEEIPVTSRILSVVDAFAHMQNEGWKGKVLQSADAMGVIKENSGSLFDPQVVDILVGVVRDDMFVGRMDAAREHVLLVDDEADITTILELKFANAGYQVSIAKSGEEALLKAAESAPDLVLSEIDLPKMNGFQFIESLKKDKKFADLPFLFLTKRDDNRLVTKAFDLGAEDLIQKPVRVEVLFAKAQKLMERIARSKRAAAPAGMGAGGVSGSLSEMSLPDIVQILTASRKTCLLEIKHENEKADIYLEEGRIVNSVYKELKGEEAFYAIVGWETGTFTMNAKVEITERLISKNTDSLMLEGFRRLDEGSKDAAPDDISMDGSDFF